MDLYLYNSASRAKERFVPRGDTVGMYCCGPTVYNYAHIGNLRTYIWEDVLKRTLRSRGYAVKHIVNITDVGHLTSDADAGEDKMEKGARREGKTVWDIASHYADAFMRDVRALNIDEPDLWPRATGHIDEMIDLVAALERKGYTYTTADGVYFDTSRFDRYCDFAGLDPDSLRAGSRIDMGEKKNATDFALWKFSPPGVKRAMEWESPWGVGFPGWHIECSAMSSKYLELPIDIHCGGQEHVRVHHTNEIAQSEAATGKQFVRFWLHGEWLVLEEGKMAKSGGNMITLSQLQEQGISPLAYRLFSFSAHYRSPLTFSWESLRGAEQSLRNLRKLVAAETAGAGESDGADPSVALGSFYAALCDDLNTSRALAAVYEMLRGGAYSPEQKKAAAREADAVLALDLFAGGEPESVHTVETRGVTVRIRSRAPVDSALIDAIAGKAAIRRLARRERDFDKADALRDELRAMGVEINDLPDGVTECSFPLKR
jgi:cysteinyl-tRNA synthetase